MMIWQRTWPPLAAPFLPPASPLPSLPCTQAGRSGDLPKGSIKVGQSQSGATHYFEPAPAIALNNAETLLEEGERKEEQAVLLRLTRHVEARATGLAAVAEAAAALDVAAARAGHARWLGSHGSRPEFVDGGWEQRQHASLDGSGAREVGGGRGKPQQHLGSPLHLPGAMHPLLLEPSLAPLPEPPSVRRLHCFHT